MIIKIGIIGAGTIASNHIKTIAEHPDFELSGLCDNNPENLKKRLELTGTSCNTFDDYHKLFAEQPDAVVIALPHGLHCQVTCEAFAAGCHVLIEKPMSNSVEECNEMLKAGKKHQKGLVLSEQASFNVGAVITGSKFRQGDLGRFFTARVPGIRHYFRAGRPQWFFDPVMSGGGMFSNVGLHGLATTRACLPGLKPCSVNAEVCFVPEYEIEACTTAMVKYSEGGSVIYEEVGYFPEIPWLNENSHFIFEDGFVSWDNEFWYMMSRKGKEYKEKLPECKDLFIPVYDNLSKAVRGEDFAPKAWEFAVDVAIVQAAYTSAREKREISLEADEWRIEDVD